MDLARQPDTIRGAVQAHLEWLGVRNYAPATIAGRRIHLRQFCSWCDTKAITRLDQIEPAVFDDFQRWLWSRCRKDGQPLSVATRVNKLIALRAWCRWLTRSLPLNDDPGRDIVLPRMPRRLPRSVLSEAEVMRIFAQPNCFTLQGLCDRAILETLYSTGMRRMEAVGLNLMDVDFQRGTVFIRAGKGDRDRVVPIGIRALKWITTYRERLTEESRRRGIDIGKSLFLNARWRRIRPTKLTERLRRYIVAAGIEKPGSVHIYRHTMATHMHEGGADIRDLQEILGHAQLSTTEIYTHVAIGRLKQVHSRTHPAERN